MKYVSCFSGIEAASLAWLPLSFSCVAVAEVEPFPCAVLEHHYPDVPNLGDVLADDFLERVAALAPDVLVGGPPCQDFSVAGLRAGLSGHRGNLTLRWVQIIHASHARFAVTENVPGWLSANDGHAFGAFLAGLVGHDTDLLPPKDCGGRWTNAGMVAGPAGRAAWRILDAQYFGLAQRRKRVFVVFCPGNGDDPSQVLFEPASLRRDFKAGRAERERVAATVAASPPSRRNGGSEPTEGHLIANPLGSHKEGGWRGDLDNDTFVADHAPALSKSNPYGDHESREGLLVAMALNAHGGSGRMDGESETFVTHSLRADGFDASEDGTGRGTPLIAFDPRQIGHPANFSNPRPGDPCHPLRGVANAEPAIAFQTSQSGVRDHDTHATLDANNGSRRHNGAIVGSSVRRLTPKECCRLQGFPDDYLDITYRGRPAADGPKYRALGNSMAVPVMQWIGKRIAAHDP